jgi:tRNA(Ile2)-agmatinylcytidine synthase
MALFHIGLDDTDSLKKGCTTYIAALLVEALNKDATFVDYPNLIRLNPNIPWKSRGNAAVCLRIRSDKNADYLLDMVTYYVKEYRDREDPKNQPGIALLKGEIPSQVKDFGKRALYDVLSFEEAMSIAEKAKVRYSLISGGRGFIGALASIGNTLEGDHTFELAVYRRKELWGSVRSVNLDSVIKMDKASAPLTFNNVDYEKGRVLITPHGPDPVLFGIRGEDPTILLDALKKVEFEGAERWVIYRSNQGTDVHLSCSQRVADLKPHQAAVIEGIVSVKPKAITGGHIISAITDGSGNIDIAAYEPSGGFRTIVKGLRRGDMIRAYGGVRVLDGNKFTFNLEKLEILDLVEENQRNPLCPECNKRMKSEGKKKGYQCKKCGIKSTSTVIEKTERALKKRIYLPPARAMRHLAKPVQRYGMEKSSWDSKVGLYHGFF